MDGCQGGKNDKETKSLRIDLENLVCERSYDDLEATLPGVQGILDVDVDRKLKAAFIDYDPAHISEKQIVGHITEIGCRIQEF